MGLIKTVKTNARRALSGCWGKAIAVLLLTILPTFLLHVVEFFIRAIGDIDPFVDYNQTPGYAFDNLTNVSIVSAIVSLSMLLLTFLVVVPLAQGAKRWFYRRSGGEIDGVSDLFFYFESGRGYFKSLWLSIQINVRLLFWLILLNLLPAAIFFLVGYAQYSGVEISSSLTALMVLLAFVWGILELILFVFIQLRYFLAPYLLAQDPDSKGRRTVKRSIRLMKGHKGEVFGFLLSFIGWWIPAILGTAIPIFTLLSSSDANVYAAANTAFLTFTFFWGIQFLMMLYVGPYMYASCALYARYLIQLGEMPLPVQAEATVEYQPAQGDFSSEAVPDVDEPTQETDPISIDPPTQE